MYYGRIAPRSPNQSYYSAGYRETQKRENSVYKKPRHINSSAKARKMNIGKPISRSWVLMDKGLLNPVRCSNKLRRNGARVNTRASNMAWPTYLGAGSFKASGFKPFSNNDEVITAAKPMVMGYKVVNSHSWGGIWLLYFISAEITHTATLSKASTSAKKIRKIWGLRVWGVIAG
jgi:hypothetical protein